MTERYSQKSSRQGALVSFRCHLSWLDEVRELLDDDNMFRLRKSCFGHLFEIKEMQFQGQLYHILIKSCLNKESEVDDRLSFTINGKFLEFGPLEYTMISGLKYSGWYEPEPSSIVHREVFGNKVNLKFSDISDAFRVECELTAGRSLLSLKLAFLYVLYSVILIRDKSNKNIQLKYLHIVDNLEMFNDYAWGRVSYEYLVRATHSRRNVIDGLLAAKKKMAYDAYGFVLALQCWTYAVMPELGKYCAEVAFENESRFPMILQWKATEFFQHDDLMSRFFSDEHYDKVVPLNPSDDEWEHLRRLGLDRRSYVPAVAPETSALKGKFAKRKLASKEEQVGCGLKEKKRACSAKFDENLRRSSRLCGTVGKDTSAESRSPVSGSPVQVVEVVGSNVTLNEIYLQLKAMDAKLSIIEKCMMQCKSWFVGTQTQLHKGLAFEATDLKEEENAAYPSMSVTLEEFLTVAQDDVAVDASMCCIISKKRSKSPNNGPASSQSRSRNSMTRSLVDEDDDEDTPNEVHGMAPFHTLLRAHASSSKPKAQRKLFTSSTLMHDPSEGSYRNSDSKTFKDWHDLAVESTPLLQTPLPVQCKNVVDAGWFEPIWIRTGWLNDENIDALVNLLIFKYNRDKDRYVNGWSAMEILPTGILQQGSVQRMVDPLMAYVNGIYPRQGAMPWEQASRVIGVANVKGNHWVCYEVSFADQRITVYDSMFARKKMKDVDNSLMNMAAALPWLCKHANLWAKKNMTTILRDVWEIEYCERAPQQPNSYDCGIMAIKYMECLISGHDVTIIDPDRCGIFRWSFCAQLYELGLKFPATVST